VITIVRQDVTASKGTPGIVNVGGKVFHTLEQPSLGNLPFKSCIPNGVYQLVPWQSKKYGDCYVAVNEDLNVFHSESSEGRPADGRFKCLFFHRGNYVKNFQGCSGAGYSYIAKLDMVTSTRKACKELNKLIAEEGSYMLTIRSSWE